MGRVGRAWHMRGCGKGRDTLVLTSHLRACTGGFGRWLHGAWQGSAGIFATPLFATLAHLNTSLFSAFGLASSLTTIRMQTLQHLMFTPVFTPTGYCGSYLSAPPRDQPNVSVTNSSRCTVPTAGKMCMAWALRLSAPIAPVATVNEDASVQRDDGDLSESVIICDPARV